MFELTMDFSNLASLGLGNLPGMGAANASNGSVGATGSIGSSSNSGNSAPKVVTAVVLRADGTKTEVQLDSDPHAATNPTEAVLGGPFTFLGQWESHGVIITMRREQEGLPASKHKLPQPFDTAAVSGDLLLTRSDDDGSAQSFTMTEFDDLVANPPEPLPELPAEEDEEEDEEEEGDDDDEDEEDEGDDDYGDDDAQEDDEGDEEEDAEVFQQFMLAKLAEKFKADNGREPDATELASLERALNERMNGGGEVAGVSDEQTREEEEASAVVVAKVKAVFKAQNGREPTEEELDALLLRLEQNAQAAAEDREGEAAEDDEAEDAGAGKENASGKGKGKGKGKRAANTLAPCTEQRDTKLPRTVG